MTDVADQKTSLLDAFAKATPRPSGDSNALVTTGAAPLVERVVGAQKVAIARDEMKILEKIKVLANAAGAEWYYRFPVKTKGGGTEFIEGPSIKLANDLARLYGNCEVDVRVTDLGDSWLIVARFTDFETGFAMTRPFQQRKSQRGMRTQDDRALDIAFQIGASKAIRNVIVNSLQTFADFAFDEARNGLITKIGKNLEAWRERCITRIDERKIDIHRVERVMGRAVKEWTAPDIARVAAMLQSIADGMTTADEAFPSSAPGEQGEGDGQESTKTNEATDQPESQAELSASPAVADPVATQSEEEIAFERGKKDRARGAQKRAIPGEYQGNSKLSIAWTNGWEAGK